ncbi:MAG: lysylphosphatidylglycerol synthase transmembrane domain-containing protein [Gemmatimonadales bacterium]|nr:lysylphosphatidylglycerol synthase transmembrane domain-containing protein [Gemmatimonadales bacterium]
MAKLLTPKVLLRGLELFLLASLVSFGAVLIYSKSSTAFLRAIPSIQFGWLLVGLGLASMDWIGGGLRNWVLARNVMPNPGLKGMILSGGMSAWAGYLTPVMSGAGPMMVYTMRRYGVPVPVGFTITFMSFIATVAFFALAGPIAIAFGAGKSLGNHGVALGISLYDLFIGSLAIFCVLGVLFLVVILFPTTIRNLVHRLALSLGRRSAWVASRFEKLERGIDQTHEAVAKFNSPRGWAALAMATVLSGPSHANKLLAGYVALRAIGIEAHFVDVLLLNTFITFVLYFFAPTPGGSGIGELLSTAVMSIYVPKAVAPLYIILWRLVISGYTVVFGSAVFYRWVRQGLKGIDQDPTSS